MVNQAEVDAGRRDGLTSTELGEIKKLKAENKHPREDVAILEGGHEFLRGRTRPPQPLILAFIDQQRTEGTCGLCRICQVLRGQGCQIAPRTYRGWARPRTSQRLLSEAQAADAVFEIVWHHGPCPTRYCGG